MKYSRGFTRLWPSVLTIAAMLVSFILLARAVDKLPLGTAYAVWTGIGVAGTAVLGIWLFSEPSGIVRVASIALILVGILGLRLSAG